jgi:hypothetical protein
MIHIAQAPMAGRLKHAPLLMNQEPSLEWSSYQVNPCFIVEIPRLGARPAPTLIVDRCPQPKPLRSNRIRATQSPSCIVYGALVLFPI